MAQSKESKALGKLVPPDAPVPAHEISSAVGYGPTNGVETEDSRPAFRTLNPDTGEFEGEASPEFVGVNHASPAVKITPDIAEQNEKIAAEVEGE